MMAVWVVAWVLAVLGSVVVLGWWMAHTYAEEQAALRAENRALKEYNSVLMEGVDEWRTRARALQAEVANVPRTATRGGGQV